MAEKIVVISAIIISVVLTFAVVFTPTYILLSESDTGSSPVAPTSSPIIDPSARFNCVPEGGKENDIKEKCDLRKCVYEVTEIEGVPSCYFPANYGAYEVVSISGHGENGFNVYLERKDIPTLYGNDIKRVTLAVYYQSESRLHFKFYDTDAQRFEVPKEMPSSGEVTSNRLYEVVVKPDPLSIEVMRKETGTVLWSLVGGFIMSDQFLQISMKLASSDLFGLGEHEHETFRRSFDYKTWGMFSRDQPPAEGNMYGVHPFYMNVEDGSHSHGLLLLNSNAMDVTLQPLPAVTYRTIGGVLDFYMFFGPSPEQVVQQYTEAIGRPYMPPYWALGFQLCRYDYDNLTRVEEVVNGMRKYDIPHDVQYGDIDYMERQLDFTINQAKYSGLQNFVDKLKEDGTRYIIILDPAISANETAGSYPPYDKGISKDIFIKNVDGISTIYGKVWPDFPNITVDESKDWEYQTEHYRAYAAFPDWMHPEAEDWWTDLILEFYNNQSLHFDGIWIDMNEPASFVDGSVNGCPDNTLDYPPYVPKLILENGDPIADKTLCMHSKQHRTVSETDPLTDHYNMHSLYGWSQTLPTLNAARAATGERSIVVTRSTFPGSGKYSGHWLGDNSSIWPHLHKSIIGMLDFNLFGIPYVGADICGFFGDSSESLCRRWMQLGAFYPYSRNHNGKANKPQDPATFGEEFANDARDVLHIRYTLLPYLYTLFYDAHTTGSTVVRPLMHEFPNDRETYDIDGQFLWGAAFMIIPVLEEDALSVVGYLPEGRWYLYSNGGEIQILESQYLIFYSPLNAINLLVRGGYIIPTQEPSNSTLFSRELPFGLIVALGNDFSANGALFWDDGISTGTIENGEYYYASFSANDRMVSGKVERPHTSMDGLVMEHLKIFGLETSVTEIVANNRTLDEMEWDYNLKTLEINLNSTSQPLLMTDDWIINWS